MEDLEIKEQWLEDDEEQYLENINDRADTDQELMTINMGPNHPSTHGVLRLIVTVRGEEVVKCESDIGYLHTGIEKQAETKTYNQALTLTDRTDYLNPLINNLGYTLAVEKLLGITERIPPKARVARILLTELQRISSHLVWLGTHAMDLGAQSTFLYGMRDREMILDIFELCAGVRMMTSYIMPGGLYADLPPGFDQKVADFLTYFKGRWPEYHQMLTNSELWFERTKGVAKMSADEALSLGVTGPMLRACGIPYDVRKFFPYMDYETYDFEVPVAYNGDVYDRFIVRMNEVQQSIRIAEQALNRLPEGDWQVDDLKIVPPKKYQIATTMESLIHHFKLYTEGYKPVAGEVYSRVESARGELSYYMVSNGTNKPYRMHIRAPSFANLQSMEPTLNGKSMFADIVAAIGSIDIILGEVDR
ncbi:MAG TPA: NADH dehydrogenase (quinone) subunit D [Chloroflexia bacterium]|nr:NADH dehydrogenase (quinone) subunit D [Chloroflexia bacterium]